MKRHHDTTRNDSDRIRSHFRMSFALFSLSLSFHRRDQSSLDHNTDYAHHHRSMKRRKYSDCVRYISVCLLLFFTLSLSLSLHRTEQSSRMDNTMEDSENGVCFCVHMTLTNLYVSQNHTWKAQMFWEQENMTTTWEMMFSLIMRNSPMNLIFHNIHEVCACDVGWGVTMNVFFLFRVHNRFILVPIRG